MFYVFKCLSYLQITFFNAEMKQSCSGQEWSALWVEDLFTFMQSFLMKSMQKYISRQNLRVFFIFY